MKTLEKEVGLVSDIFIPDIKGKGHTYTLNGKKLTGVTTILGVIAKGDGLTQWSANEAIEFVSKIWKGGVLYTKKELPEIFAQAKIAWKTSRDTAGASGMDVHNVIETLVKWAIQANGGYIDIDSHENKQIDNFLKWARGVKFLESEKSVYSKELWIAGTLDIVYEKDGEVYLGDIKTAKSIYPTNYWQMSAYQFMLQEMGLYPKIKGFTVIRLGKDGSFEVGENYAFADNIEGFKSALTIYRKLNLISEKNPFIKSSNKKVINI